MLYLIIGLIAATAGGGMVALAKVLKGEKPARAVVLLHGLFAAVVVVLLALDYYNGNSAVGLSLVLYIAAAVGGYYLLFKDLTGKVIPKGMAVGHALIAVASTVILLVKVFL